MALCLLQGQDITRCEFLLFYFLIFKTIHSCGCLAYHLRPVESGSLPGPDPEGTALTASDAARVSQRRDSRGALVRLRVKPVPGGLSAGGAKTEPGREPCRR